MWYAPIGFGMTFIIGLLLSYCLNMLCKKQEVVQDPNLFFPIIGNRIRRRQLGTLGINECELSKDVSGQRKYIFTINKSKEVENGDDISITKI